MTKKYKFTTAKQVGGDDGYCWTIFVNGKEKINGLTKSEVPYYRDKFEKEEQDKITVANNKFLDFLSGAI